MCAIFGLYKKKEPISGSDKEMMDRMSETIKYRGPDDRGFYYAKKVALGNNLLSIVDVKNGHQPMIKEFNGNKYAIVYNGEIFNYKFVKRQVELSGLIPKTYCDTEIVLLAYIAFGEDCVNMFDGQFAFAIWNEKKEKLFLARDIAGIKPLFYSDNHKEFYFASEPKILFQYSAIDKAPNYSAICEYFLHGYAFASGYITGENTFYDGIIALPPAHTLTVSSDGKQLKRYWDITLSDDRKELDYYADQIREILTSKISNYVSNEVTVGTALSGGLDSSIITVLAAYELNDLEKDLIVRSIKYKQVNNEDYENAKYLADHLRESEFKLNFGPSLLSPETYLNDLDSMIYHFDEPHWEIKQLAMFNNYKALKEAGAKVVLTGEGADEMFLGYFQKFPGFRNPEFHSIDDFRSAWSRRIPNVKELFSSEFNDTYSGKMTGIIDKAIEKYYAPYFDQSKDHKKSMQCWYYHTFLHWLLTVNDRCSMAFSLEGRFPFLDKEIIELAFSIPASMNIDNNSEKIILRNAFKDIIPEKILWRNKAPLPSPLDLRFHKKIQEAFESNINSAHSSIWDVLSRQHIERMNQLFKEKIQYLERKGLNFNGGRNLTGYIYLNQDIELRTVYIFSVLTLLRWFNINFYGGTFIGQSHLSIKDNRDPKVLV